MKTLRPGHRSSLTVMRGKVRLTCVCGWQSSLQANDEEGTELVHEEYDAHLNLRESERYSN